MRIRVVGLLLAVLLLLAPAATGQEAREVVPAPIDEVEVLDGATLRVVSGLPNGCHRFHEARAEREGTCIRVTVTNTRPTDPERMCTMIYGMHTSEIALGDLEPGTEYTVWLNDEGPLTFTAE